MCPQPIKPRYVMKSKYKVVILGMNSPKSTEALGTKGRRNGTGIRLLRLSGMNENDYAAKFERMNLVNEREWILSRAQEEARKLLPKLNGRTVVVLGWSVWKVLCLPNANCLERVHVKDSYHRKGINFYLIPHPSGRNLWYNDLSNRTRVRRFLRRL